jgi:hypothetical protein
MLSGPAAAQQYGPNSPVCLQKWEWGGSNTVNCSYPSWEACQAAASGLPAMCLANPYWPQPGTVGAGRGQGERRAQGRSW